MTIKTIPFLSQRVKALEWLLLTFFFIFPFQRRIKHIFSSAFKHIIPENVPDFFSKHLNFYVSDFLIIIITFLCLYQRRSQIKEFFLQGPAKYLSLLFVVMMISVIQTPFQYPKLIEFLLTLLFFCATLEVFRSFAGTTLLKKIFYVIIAASLIECAIGTTQYFTQSGLGLRAFGEPDFFFPLPMPCEYRWIFDPLLNITSSAPFLHRATGTFTHPNILGGFLLLSTFVTYHLFTSEGRRIFLFALLLQFFTLSITFSRSAIIACFACTILWFVLHPKTARLKDLFITVSASALICFLLLYPQILSRGGLVNYNKVSKCADVERVVYQSVALEMFKENPILGVGSNNFQLNSPQLASEEHPHVLHSKVHNIYLLILSELGILGGIAFFLFLFSVLKKSFRKSAWTPLSLTFLCLFTGYLFIGGCDFYFLETGYGKIMFFGTAAMLWLSTEKRFIHGHT